MQEPHQKESENKDISSCLLSIPSVSLHGRPRLMGVLGLTSLRHHEDKRTRRSLYFLRFQTGEDEFLH